MQTKISLFRLLPNRSIPAILAVLLYVLPSLVQDAHRLMGHQEILVLIHADAGQNIHKHIENCPVCVFEFYSVDEINSTVSTQIINTGKSIFKINSGDQLSTKVFDYSQLRAPPVS
jgi:hypothetical protein